MCLAIKDNIITIFGPLRSSSIAWWQKNPDSTRRVVHTSTLLSWNFLHRILKSLFLVRRFRPSFAMMARKHLSLLFGLIWAVSVISANRPSYIYGRHAANDVLVKNGEPITFNKPSTSRSARYVYSFYSNNRRAFTEIGLYDQDMSGNGATPKIIQGGVGKSFVDIEFETKPRHGALFAIQLYTGGPTSWNRLDAYSRQIFIEGDEVAGHELLVPKTINVMPDCVKIYEYTGSPAACITKIEVLGESPRPNSCEPEICSGGVGQHFVSFRCKDMSVDFNFFLVKIFVLRNRS